MENERDMARSSLQQLTSEMNVLRIHSDSADERIERVEEEKSL